MSYMIHKTLQTYWDALAHYNLLESNVSNFQRKGEVVIIDTPQRVYFKTIKHQDHRLQKKNKD